MSHPYLHEALARARQNTRRWPGTLEYEIALVSGPAQDRAAAAAAYPRWPERCAVAAPSLTRRGRCGSVRPGPSGGPQSQAYQEVVDHFIRAWPGHFRLAGAQVGQAVQQ